MANVIENRVVELGFDNKNFEQNARTSIGTLGKLDEALQFKGVASGFRSIQNGLRYLDFSPITSSLSSVQNAFTNIGAAIKVNFFDMLGNEAIRLGKSIVDNTLGQIKSGGLSRALNIEQAQFKVKGLKGDWEKVYEDMDYAVSGTAYGIDEAASAASQFLASGVKTGDDMKAALRGISGIAAMASADYSSIADIFTAAAGKGKVQAMELQRIALHGINATAELAKQMGTTEENIRDMASKGEIDFATFAKAMDTAFGEHAKKANETYTGSLSNVKSALSRIGEIWYEPWIHGLIPIFNELRLSIDKFKNALKTPLNESGDTIATQLKKIMEVGSELVTFLIDSLNPFLDKLPYKFEPILKKMQDFYDKTESLRDIFKAFTNQQKTKDPFDPIAQAAKKAGDKVHKITEEEKAAAEQIMKNGSYNSFKTYDEFKKAGLSYLTIKKYIKELNLEKEKNKNLTKEEKEEQDKLAELTKKYSKEIGVLNRVYDIFTKVGNVAHLIFEKLVKVFNIAKESFNNVFPGNSVGLIETIVDCITELVQKFEISGERAEYLRRIFTGLFSALEFVKTAFEDALNFIEPFIRVAAAGHPTILSWLADLGDFFRNINNYRQATGEYPALIKSIIDMAEMAFRTIRLIWQKIEKIFNTAVEAFEEVWAEFRPENSPFPDLVTSITDLVRGFKISGERAELFKTIFKGIFSVIHTGYILFKEFKELTENIFSAIFGEAKEGEPIILRVLARFSEWVHQLSLDIKEVAESGGLFDIIFLIFKRIGEAIKSLFTGKTEDGQEKFDGFFDGMKDKIKEGVQSAIDWLAENKPISSILEFFSDIDFSGIFGGIFGAVGDFFRWIQEALADENSIISRFINAVAGIFEEVARVVESQLPNINMIFNDIADFLHHLFVDNPDMAEKAGGLIIQVMETLTDLLKFIGDILPAVKEPLIEILHAISEILKALGQSLEKWAKFIGDDPETTFGMVAFILIIYIIKQFMNFFKTTTLVSFDVALRRIYTSISVFFGNLSGLAFRAGQLMWAKEISTLATAILKVALALAIVGAVVAYQSDNYDGAKAGLAMLVAALIAVFGFLMVADTMKGIMEAGVGKMFMLGTLMNALATAILVVAIAFALISSTMGHAGLSQIIGSIATLVLIFVGMGALLSIVAYWTQALSLNAARTIPTMAMLAGFLIAFAAVILILSAAYAVLLEGMRMLYFSAGKDETAAIAMFVGVGAVLALMMMGIVAIISSLATIQTISIPALVGLVVIAGIFVSVIGALALIMVALQTADVDWKAWIGAGIAFIGAIVLLQACITAMMTITTFANTEMVGNKTGILLAFAMVAVLMILLTKTMNDIALVTLAMKLVTAEDLYKMIGIFVATGLLFAAAVGAVYGLTKLTELKMNSRAALANIAVTAAIFLILVDGMKTIAEVAKELDVMVVFSFGMFEEVLLTTVGMFAVATAVVAALTVISRKIPLSGRIGLLLALGSISFVFKLMINMMKSLADLIVEFSSKGIKQEQVDMVMGVFNKIFTIFEWFALLTVASGAIAGFAGGGVALVGVIAISAAMLLIAASIKIIADAVATLGEIIIKYAFVWPLIRENVRMILKDLQWVIPEAIESISLGIILGIPAILAAIYVVFVAINAFFALIMPTQAAIFLLGLNAFLDVILIGADVIVAKLFIFLDIILVELDAQADILGYEITMIVLKALWGALKAIGKFLMYAGEENADAFYNKFKGTLVDRLSDMAFWDNLGDLIYLLAEGETFDQTEYQEKLDSLKFHAEKDKIKSGEMDLSAIKKQAKEDYKEGAKAAEEGFDEAKKETKSGETTYFNTDDIKKDVKKQVAGYQSDESEKELLDAYEEAGIDTGPYKQIKEDMEKAKTSQEAGESEGGNFITGLLNGIGINFGSISEGLGEMFTNMDFVKKVKEWGSGAGDNFMGGFKDALPKPEDMMKELNFDTGNFGLNLDQLKEAGMSDADIEKLMTSEEWQNGFNNLGAFGDNQAVYESLGFDNLFGGDYQSMISGQLQDVDGAQVEVQTVDPQIEALINNLSAVNEQLTVLNEKVAESIIVPKGARFNLISELDGAQVAQKTYPITTIMGLEESAMREDGLATPSRAGTPYWSR